MNPTESGYSTDGEVTLSQVNHPSGPSLPLTGMDLGLVGGFALTLVVIGVAMRRLTRPA